MDEEKLCKSMLQINQCCVERMWHQQKQSVTDGWTTDRVILMWRFALLMQQKS